MDTSRSSATSGGGPKSAKEKIETFCPGMVRITGGSRGKSVVPKHGFLAYHPSASAFVVYFEKKKGLDANIPEEQLKFRSSDVKKLGSARIPKGANYSIAFQPGTIDADEVVLIKIDDAEKARLHNLLVELVGVKDTRSLVETKSTRSSQLRPTVRPAKSEDTLPVIGDYQGSAASTAPTERRASAVRFATRPSTVEVEKRPEVQPKSILSSSSKRPSTSAHRVRINEEGDSKVTLRKPIVRVGKKRLVPSEPVDASPPPSAKKHAPFADTPVKSLTPPRYLPSSGSKYSPRYLPEVNELAKGIELCGLLNIGLTCFMNAVLQCVFTLDFNMELVTELRTYFPDDSPDSRKDKYCSTAPFTMAYARLYGKRYDEGRRRSLLNELKKQMVGSGKFEEMPRDEDAHEFFVFMLDQMQREMEALRSMPGVGSHPEELKTAAFNFCLEQVFSCELCDKEWRISDTGNHLILQCGEQDENRSELRSVAGLLSNALGTGMGSEQRKCSECTNPLKLTRVCITAKPRYLVLMLTRYSYDKDSDYRAKTSSPVAILSSLNISDDTQPTMPRQVPHPASRSSVGTELCKRSRTKSQEDPFGQSFSGSSSSSNASGEVEVTEVKMASQDRFYTPVDYEWRKETCSLLSIDQHFIEDKRRNVYEPYVNVDQVDPTYRADQAPYTCSEVLADGNCLFRALSHVITGGSEEAHLCIRREICAFMELHRANFQRMMGKHETDFDDYLMGMKREGTWGSDIELRACASLIRTTITTFVAGRWTSYPPLSITDDADQSNDRHQTRKGAGRRVIYLANEHSHYSPVLSISKRVKYELRAIVNHVGGCLDSGHYVNFLQDPKGGWYKCNDSSIDPCQMEEALEESTSTSYMLFYERKR